MKKILVTQTSMPPYDEYIDEIKDIWESHWLTNMGPKHNKLQGLLKDYLTVDNISLFTNGHNALELCLQAMNLTGEVITTPFTFASTTHAIVRNGLTPVFCDINPLDYTIDVNKIEVLITDKTTAIVPVHVYGNVCNTDEIDRIAQKYGLKVIYDAAHVFGVRYKGLGIGNFGDASMFSFHATKVYHTIEGGAICYHDEELGRELYKLCNFGIKDPETIDGVGSNAKMNEFVAAMGLCTLRHVDEEIAKRKRVVDCYRKNLDKIDGIQLPPIQDDVQSNFAYFPIVIDEKKFGSTRNEIFKALAEDNINARKYFYPLTSAFDAYKGRFDPYLTPVALYISKRVLTIPLYADLPLDDVKRISNIIKRCKR
ncbi:DegT/DnrJ/EryC1/StrS family aminotransferase [Parabacteroides distasonis]|jgi:dTDP-4-amino-4,6-dideoxygalactose transaminase|uniref:DegT/DnrJ/EryC1/StrS family aminotransferase n=1 Tax=Parabacteroides distasonis TaxID=823 RepID=UPI0018996B43|nr:DegT/DnrJ/EryC1/StrS family aminotransferase [Parabacteroides distasonis]MDB8998139.1 DegT/DnrJ/EryC1/StrS family aminotransferase [Parabacteroides distasonis]MDB9072756.1 DegT/DnrJ/EryC1/StrS family aminotransferase [Parabacteroides distasonis]